MTKYTCEKCGYNTTRKQSYNSHLKRKTPCKKPDNISTETVSSSNEEINDILSLSEG